MTELNLSFIGLMKRAGALIPGADGIYDAARAGSLIRLILLASDAGPNTKKGLLNAREECGAPMVTLQATKAELGAVLGQKECAAAAVTDTGFAKALCEKLGETQLAEQLDQRLQREVKRKAKKQAQKEVKPTAAENARAALRRKQAAAAKKGGAASEKPVTKTEKPMTKSAKPVAKTAKTVTKNTANQAAGSRSAVRTGDKSNTNKRGNRSW